MIHECYIHLCIDQLWSFTNSQVKCVYVYKAHRLAIQTGRWHKPYKIPKNESTCLYCGVLQDEFHFLSECTLLQLTP